MYPIIKDCIWQPIEPGSDDEIRDTSGYTHPYLHRRTSDDTEGRDYTIGIHGLNSYRTTELYTHDEESTDSEIP